MRQLSAAGPDNFDIRTAVLVLTYTADADREIFFRIFATVVGNGDYTAYLTIQRLGAGAEFRVSPITTAAVASGVTSMALQSGTICVKNTDVVKIYLVGLAGDSATSAVIREVWDSCIPGFAAGSAGGLGVLDAGGDLPVNVREWKGSTAPEWRSVASPVLTVTGGATGAGITNGVSADGLYPRGADYSNALLWTRGQFAFWYDTDRWVIGDTTFSEKYWELVTTSPMPIGTFTATSATATPGTGSPVVAMQPAAALTAYDPPTNTEMEARTLVAANYATATSVTTVLDRIGAFTGTGWNTILGFFRAMFRKDAGVTLPSDIGGTFANTTDSLEAVRDGSLILNATNATGAFTSAVVANCPTGSTINLTNSQLSLGTGTKITIEIDQNYAWSRDIPCDVAQTGDAHRFAAFPQDQWTTPLWTLDNSHCTVGGTGNKTVTVADDDDKTATAGTFSWMLVNTTDDTVAAWGVLNIRPRGDIAST